ncbi:MAG TPA: hypothetical protein ENH05_03655 [Rhizobiales bacterium]|nr:hypothetical protein BMS3Bbin10_00291 [bacterium BMS3Bbin10]HDO51815.1 hypothetical protein [Hyphomicrobiales bacterium]
MRRFRHAGAVPLATLFWAAAASFCLTSQAVAEPMDGSPGPAGVTSVPAPEKNPIRQLADLRSRLDYKDRVVAMRALQLALSQVPDGGTFVWQKKSRSLKGLIKPTRAFRNADGQLCRHVIYALALGRYTKQIEGIACRLENGRWQL